MAISVPIRDLKNTAAFAKTVEESSQPVIVTRNGYDEFVVMRSSDYEQMVEELAKAKLLRVLAEAERDYRDGNFVDEPVFVQQIRAKYGL